MLRAPGILDDTDGALRLKRAMSAEKLHAWESSIRALRSGGMAAYEALIVGLASGLCLSMTFVYHLSLSKAILALFSFRTIGLFMAVWALQFGLMEGASLFQMLGIASEIYGRY